MDRREGVGGDMGMLTLEQAGSALQAAVGKAMEIGSPSSIAIVDDGRNLVAFARMDDALLASIEIAQGKAYTARSMNMNTADIGPLTQPGQPLYGIESSHAAHSCRRDRLAVDVVRHVAGQQDRPLALRAGLAVVLHVAELDPAGAPAGP